MRHFLFTVPPIAVLAGLGLNGLLGRLETLNRSAAAGAAAVVLLGLGWNAATLYRLHPDEYLFFNPLVGGLAGASRNYATDYWVNIMPEAVSDLEHFLDRTERLRQSAPAASLSGRGMWRAGVNSRKRPTVASNGRGICATPISSSRRPI